MCTNNAVTAQVTGGVGVEAATLPEPPPFTCLPRITVIAAPLNAPPRGVADAADYAVPPGDWSDCSDQLGDWEKHKFEERLQCRQAFAHRKARIATGGNAKFCFPDQCEVGTSWLETAGRLGARKGHLAKASAMAARGLGAKARRQAYCGVLGARYDCASFGPGHGHKFYLRFNCKCRYCPDCGPKAFRGLLAKHIGLKEVASKLAPHWPHKRDTGRVVAKLDFTTKNLNRMPKPEEVQAFNGCIRRFGRRLERELGISRKDYGLIYCDEFGGKLNTNLHAHGIYVGPRLPRPKPKGGTKKLGKLAEWWRDACAGTVFAGSFIISVKPAKSFEDGLAHALKYAGKFLSRDPERLADLEATFHRVRRVHTLAAFYNAVRPAPASTDGESGLVCPLCSAALLRVGGWSSISALQGEGRLDLFEVRQQAARREVFAGPKGAPT